MALSLTQTALVRITASQAITNNLLRLLALSPSVSISGSVATADLAAGAVTAAKTTPGAYFYGALSGTNAYTLSLSPSLAAYADGVEVLGKVGNANTAAATATLNVDTLGAKNIYHGATGELLKAGDLPANALVHFVYNSTRNASAGGWDVREVIPSTMIRPATNVTEGTATVQTLVNTPPITAYAAGVLLLVKVGAGLTNTGALTLNCDGAGARSVLRPGGATLLAGDWVAGQTYLVYDDGTQFILLTKEPPVAVAASTRNLWMYPNNTNRTYQIDVTADEVVLKTSNGLPMLASAVSLTLDLTLGVALNSFETGATRTTETWYYVWLISDGTNVRGVLESAGTGDGAAPGGPDLTNGAFAGYTYTALIGQVRLNATGAGEIVQFVQADRRVWTVEQVILAATVPAGADDWEVLVGTDRDEFRAAVPPTATACSGLVGADNTTDTAAIMLCAVRSTGGLASTGLGIFVGAQLFQLQNMGSTYNGFGGAVPFNDLSVRGGTGRNIQWKSRLTSLTVSLSVTGYTF